jgi:hypothetical protein
MKSPKNFKVDHLSNHYHLSDLSQILNLHLGDQTKIQNCLKLRYIKSWKAQQSLVGSSQNLNLLYQTKNENYLKWRWPQNIKSWISYKPLVRSFSKLALPLGDQTKIGGDHNTLSIRVLGGKCEETSQEISSVALLSPAQVICPSCEKTVLNTLLNNHVHYLKSKTSSYTAFLQ